MFVELRGDIVLRFDQTRIVTVQDVQAKADFARAGGERVEVQLRLMDVEAV